MQQDKSTISIKIPSIKYRKRIYKLKGISYMSLSLMYIALILTTAIVGLILIATFIAKDHYLGMILTVVFVCGIIMSLYSIGVKYGEYGLEILIGKAFQKKHIKNDFPRIEGALLLDLKLFPNQTLIKVKKDKDNNKDILKESKSNLL